MTSVTDTRDSDTQFVIPFSVLELLNRLNPVILVEWIRNFWPSTLLEAFWNLKEKIAVHYT